MRDIGGGRSKSLSFSGNKQDNAIEGISVDVAGISVALTHLRLSFKALSYMI